MRFSKLCLILLMSLWGRCAFPADEGDLTYTVRWEGLEDHPVVPILESRSRTVQLLNVPPPSQKLLELRAKNDVPTLQNVLHAEGYFLAEIDVRVEEQEDGTLVVIYPCTPGPLITLSQLTISTPPEHPPRSNWRPVLEPGDPVTTVILLAAEQRALRYYRTVGHPFPKPVDRDILVNPETGTAEVTLHLDPGPVARFGELVIEGLVNIDERFVERQHPWEKGNVYDYRLVEEFEKDLIQSGLFSQVRVIPQRRGDDGETVDLKVSITERYARSVRLGANHRTDVGFGVNASWEHRNAFGQGERLSTRLIVAEIEKEAEIGLRLPGFQIRNQTLMFILRASEEETDAYDSDSLEGYLGLDRALNSKLSLRMGVGTRYASVVQGPTDEEYGLVMLPVQLFRDSSNDDLHPIRGSRLSLEVAPTADVMGGEAAYIRTQFNGSRYIQVMRRPQLVLAGRLTLGTLAGSELQNVPADERYYSGGGGSVRGFVYQDIGPKVEDNPVGGTSLAELSLEARIRQTEMLGWTLFLDGGQVSQSDFPLEDESMSWAAGIGLRLFTGIGPLRVDVAHPLNAMSSQTNDWQVYISLGQAF